MATRDNFIDRGSLCFLAMADMSQLLIVVFIVLDTLLICFLFPRSFADLHFQSYRGNYSAWNRPNIPSASQNFSPHKWARMAREQTFVEA